MTNPEPEKKAVTTVSLDKLILKSLAFNKKGLKVTLRINRRAEVTGLWISPSKKQKKKQNESDIYDTEDEINSSQQDYYEAPIVSRQLRIPKSKKINYIS